jgi:hypothetical protein
MVTEKEVVCYIDFILFSAFGDETKERTKIYRI